MAPPLVSYTVSIVVKLLAILWGWYQQANRKKNLAAQAQMTNMILSLSFNVDLGDDSSA